MSENENVVAQNEIVQKESFGAKFKEWGRKRVVNLKRKTQVIPLFFYLVASIMYLISLYTLSQAINFYQNGAAWTGLAMFINTLFSILILVMYLNAFPKRKKPNIIFLVLVFLTSALLIGMDVWYYINLSDAIAAAPKAVEGLSYMPESLSICIAHIVLVGISVVVLALLPVYKRLIMKINTTKHIESNNMNEKIDTAED